MSGHQKVSMSNWKHAAKQAISTTSSIPPARPSSPRGRRTSVPSAGGPGRRTTMTRTERSRSWEPRPRKKVYSGRGDGCFQPDFSFQDFVSHRYFGQVFAGEVKTEFKLAIALAQRLQELKEACRPKNRQEKAVLPVVKRLSANGLTIY